MVAALELAKNNDGFLTRHTGGFWAGPVWSKGLEYATTQTVAALVARGFLEIRERREVGCFQIATRVVLTDKGAAL